MWRRAVRKVLQGVGGTFSNFWNEGRSKQVTGKEQPLLVTFMDSTSYLKIEAEDSSETLEHSY
jgi:hypothetical protein